MTSNSLDQLVIQRVISESMKTKLKQLQNMARGNDSPFVVPWESRSGNKRYLYIFVWVGFRKSYSLTGRVLVTVDLQNKVIRCKGTVINKKAVGPGYFFQNPKKFRDPTKWQKKFRDPTNFGHKIS